MFDPYTALGIPTTAGDQEVRNAYLEAVRESPPEKDPDRFQRIRSAYEILSTLSGRLNHDLFDMTEPTAKDVFNRIATSFVPGRPSEQQILNRLSGSD